MRKILVAVCALMMLLSGIHEGTAAAAEGQNMYLQIGDRVLTAKMVDNSSTQALFELLAEGPLTLHMSDYAGMEKGAQLPKALPQNNEPMNTVPGDIILYQGRTFVIYYDTNSWSLTPLGKVQNVTAEELRELLGTGDVDVTLSLKASQGTEGNNSSDSGGGCTASFVPLASLLSIPILACVFKRA